MWKYTGKAFARNFCETWKNARVVWHVELHVPPQAQQQQTLVVLWPWMVLCSPFLSQQLGNIFSVGWFMIDNPNWKNTCLWGIWVIMSFRKWVTVYTCDWCKEDRSISMQTNRHPTVFFWWCVFLPLSFHLKGLTWLVDFGARWLGPKWEHQPFC